MNAKYSDAEIAKMSSELFAIGKSVENMFLQYIEMSKAETDPRVVEFLNHGVARRIRTLGRAVSKVFELLPTSNTLRFDSESISDAQIYLQSFMINTRGVLDNLAWACVVKCGLVGGGSGGLRRNEVDLFGEKLLKHMPPSIRTHIRSAEINKWYTEYFKEYRDSLAHRIPFYIPPAEYTQYDADRHRKLYELECDARSKWNFPEVERIQGEIDLIGSPCFRFLYSFENLDSAPPRMFHSQMLIDLNRVIDICQLFCENWNGFTPAFGE